VLASGTAVLATEGPDASVPILEPAPPPHETVAELERKVRETPMDPDLHYRLAVACEREGKLDQAEAEYSRVLAWEPDSAFALGGLGWVLLLKGEYPRSLDYSRQAVGRYEKLHPARYNIGLALAAQGKLAEAVAAYKEALASDPDRKQASSAVKDANVLAVKDPRNGAIHYVMAMLYGALGVPTFERVSLEAFVAVGGPPEQMDNAYRRLRELRPATDPATP
jgi:tetratricopeptide (TPR) repeat protein